MKTPSDAATLPLRGKRILVARTSRQGAPTVAHLKQRGAMPVVFPLIEVEPYGDGSMVESAIDALKERRYQVVAFTSDNGVTFFVEALVSRGEDPLRLLGSVRVAAVGVATARALEARGLVAAIVAPRFVAEELAGSILALEPRPERVLFPRALAGREALPEALRAAGVEVDVLPVYRTLEVTPARGMELASVLVDVDVILLTSGSMVRSLAALLGQDASARLAGVTLASIGPVTSAAAGELGLEVAVTAEESTLPGLVAALERHLVAAR